MQIGFPNAFLLLILAQAAHSLEEYFGALWEVLAPARAVSGFFSANLPAGFATANTLVVLLGVLCYLGPVRNAWRGNATVAWFWVILESANGIGHTLFALQARAYFPGLYTAPLLIASAVLVAYHLLNSGSRRSGRLPGPGP